MKKAFTLAEVLITLGIIGIVAAMTLPVLIENHQKKTFISQFKKVYATLKNAELMAVNEYGDSKGWDYSDAKTFIETYYLPYLSYIPDNGEDNDYKIFNLSKENLGKWYTPSGLANVNYFKLTDGTKLRYWINNQFFVLTADVNGSRLPNTYGKDIWDFELNWSCPKCLVAGGAASIKTSDYDTIYTTGCKEYQPHGGSPNRCADLLIFNNYNMNDKYPWK